MFSSAYEVIKNILPTAIFFNELDYLNFIIHSLYKRQINENRIV